MENTVQSQILDGLYKALKKQIDFYSSDTYKIDTLGKDERSTVLTELGNIHTKLTAFANSDTLVTLNDVETLKAEYNTLISNIDSLKGAKGDKGDKGDTGLNGEKGDAGYSGLFSSIAEPFLFGSTLLSGSSLSFGVTPGKYLNSSGVEVNLSSYSFTSYIPVVPLKKYKVDAIFVDSACLCLYDKYGKFISSINGLTHSSNSKILTVPSGVYFIRCSFNTSGNLVVTANEDIYYSSDYIEINKTLRSISEGLAALNSFFEDFNYSNYITSGKYLSSSGSVYSLASFNYIKIPVFAGDSFYISGTVVAGARLHNANGISFPSESYASNTLVFDKIHILSDGYLEMSYLSASPFVLKRLIPSISDFRENIYSLSLFSNKVFHRNVLALGDSLTSGGNYADAFAGAPIEECYPYYLNLLSNWKVTNAGFNGINPSNFYLNKLPQYNAINYDSCILWLGTNGGLTDTIDADIASGNYLTYANTETGKYCAIIETLLSQNPNLKIYLLSVFGAGGGSVSVTNNVIKKIADKYAGVYFIDINVNNRIHPATYIHVANGIHFDKIGNKIVAEYIFLDILKTIKNNLVDYNKNILGTRVSTVFDNL